MNDHETDHAVATKILVDTAIKDAAKRRRPIVIAIAVFAVCFALGIGALLGSNTASRTNDETAANQSVIDASDEFYSYSLDIGSNYYDIINATGTLGDIMGLFDDSQTWRDQMESQLSYMEDCLNEAYEIDPPANANTLHNQYMKGVSMFQEAVTLYRSALENGNVAAIDQAGLKSIEALELMTSVFDSTMELSDTDSNL